MQRWFYEHPHDGLGIVTGECSGVFVVDVDPRNGGWLERTETGWLLFSRGVELGELPLTRVHRTGGGGWHVFLSYFPGLSNAPLVDGVDIKTDGGQIVAPPSVHVSGKRYTVLEARAVADAPAWLLVMKPEQHTEDEDAAHTENLSPTNEKNEGAETFADYSKDAARTTGAPTALRGFFSEERTHARMVHGRRNSELTRYAGRRRFEGADDDELRADVHRMNRTAPDPLPAKEVDKVTKSVARYQKGKGRTSEEFARARALANRLEELAAHIRWPGVAGATERTCLLALLAIVRTCGRTVVTVSTRQLTEAAGVSERKSVSRALRALAAGGWLRRLATGRGDQGSTFQLRRPPKLTTEDMPQEDPTIPPEGEVALLGYSCGIGHDAFRWRALGKNGAVVLAALERQSWPSARKLALDARPRLSPDTAERNLKKLELCGLAVRDERGWHRGTGTLEDAARMFGTAGRGAAEKSKHAAEREAYRDELVERAAGRQRRRLMLVEKGGKNDGATSTKDNGPTAHTSASWAALDGAGERAGVHDVREQDAHVAARARVGVGVRMVHARTAGQGSAR